MSTDWPQIDSSVSIHSSNDLFGGDLFGDELIEMYAGTDMDTDIHNQTVTNTKIQETGTCTPPSLISNSHVTHLDDGLGALTDITDLMQPMEQAPAPAAAIITPVPVPSTDIVTNHPSPLAVSPNQKKRASPTLVTAPVVKKANTGTRAPVVSNASKRVNVQSTARRAPTITSAAKNQLSQKGLVHPGNVVSGINGPLQHPGSVVSGNATNHHGSNNNKNSNSNNGNGNNSQAQTPNPLDPGTTANTGAVVSPLPSAVNNVNNTVASTNTTIVNSTNHAITAKSSSGVMKNTNSRGIAHPVTSVSSNVISRAAPRTITQNLTNGTKPTESDFVAVAQAAVSNLIMNAGAQAHQLLAQKQSQGEDFLTKGTPNTSTAHVAALTSSNWVAACASMSNNGSSHTSVPAPGTNSMSPIPPNNVTAAAAASVVANSAIGTAVSAEDDPSHNPNSAANKRRRQNLNPEERARQNRDRNREHARNTRLRKKAYVEELKRTLTELVTQRDASELERRHNTQREMEQREVRFRVMEEFLKLRGSMEQNVARWVAILEDGFKLTLPVTSYREIVAPSAPHNTKLPRSVSTDDKQMNSNNYENSDAENCELSRQVLHGATECMADASILSRLLNSLGNGAANVGNNNVTLAHNCDRKRFFMDGTTAVLEWTATSVGAVTMGAPAELVVRGNMKAIFSPASNKLISAEILFDTGAVYRQIKRLSSHYNQSSSNHIHNGYHDDFTSELFGSSSNNNGHHQTKDVAAEADALLDSLQMPMLPGMTLESPTPNHVPSCNVDDSNSGHHHNSEKSVISSDESEDLVSMDKQ